MASLAFFAGGTFAAEDASSVEGANRIYSAFSRVTTSRPYEVVTNGTAVAKFLDRAMKGLPAIWNADASELVGDIGKARFLIAQSMLGDRMDITVSGDPMKSTALADRLAKTSARRLALVPPVKSTSAFVSTSNELIPFEGGLSAVRVSVAEPLRSLLPADSLLPGFAVFTISSMVSDGEALVCAVEKKKGVKIGAEVLGGFAKRGLLGLFELSECTRTSEDGIEIFRYTLSTKAGAITSVKSELPELVRFLAVANDVIGPVTMEVAEHEEFVFFEIGAVGDLANNLGDGIAAAFPMQSLLPVLCPDVKNDEVRSYISLSPSAVLNQTVEGITSVPKARIPEMPPVGDGYSMIISVESGGRFTWGWSLSQNELQASEATSAATRSLFQAIFLQGAEQKLLRGNR